jgi:hypothetical protein
VRSVLEAINRLNYQNDDRYLKDDEDGYEICCLIDELAPPQKARFCKIRRDDFPQVEHKGNLADLVIPDEYGLAECVHAIFFPENVVGLPLCFHHFVFAGSTKKVYLGNRKRHSYNYKDLIFEE